ncbi:MAG: TraI domain-containing protein, partial [Gammaproteobacteria bacterium]
HKLAVSYDESSLFPILTAENLLSGAETQQLLVKINNWAAMPAQYYDEFYQSLIDQFAEYAQILPNQQRRLGGLLIESLRQACLALQIYHEDAMNEIDPLFAYALFSAGLLLNVPRLFYKTAVICDEKGIGLSTWSPLAGSLVGTGSHYKVRDYGLRAQQINPYLRILLASNIMPQTGLQWLAEDKEIFAMWLSVLGADEEGSGTLGLILNKMKMLFTSLAQDYLPSAVKIRQPEGIAEGEAFFAWLKDELVAQPNWELVRISEDGLVLSEQAFQRFSELHPNKSPDWRKVAAQFRKLGCTTELNEQKAFEYEEEFTTNSKPTQNKTNKKAQQQQNFFNQNDNKLAQNQTAAFKDCLVIEEKNLLRKLLRNSILLKELEKQEKKILAKKRIAGLVRWLKIRAKRKRLLAAMKV